MRKLIAVVHAPPNGISELIISREHPYCKNMMGSKMDELWEDEQFVVASSEPFKNTEEKDWSCWPEGAKELLFMRVEHCHSFVYLELP